MRKIFALLILPVFLVLSLFMVSALSITLTVPAQYQEIHAGDQVYVQTEVKWPENTVKQDLTIEYSIQDKKTGEQLAYLKVLRAVGTQASFLDSIPIPQSAKSGIYYIYENVTNSGSLSEQTAASFNVIQKDPDIFTTYLFVILGVVGLISVLVVVELFILLKRRS